MAAGRKLERLEEAKTVDDVVRNLDVIIAWAIETASPIGYFATLYKRSTVAVRAALLAGEFEDTERMERFDAVFAQRYFAALNAYFYPDEYEDLTLAWEVTFAARDDEPSTMLQHMVSGLNAHISYDLGVSAAAIAVGPPPVSLRSLEHDFNLINALVIGQTQGMLDVAETLSPALTWFRKAIPDEVGFIRCILIRFRKAAWLFAIHLAMYPEDAREKRVNQASFTAALCAWLLEPTGRLSPVPLIVRAIAWRESKDIAKNIAALDEITPSPEMKTKRYM